MEWWNKIVDTLGANTIIIGGTSLLVIIILIFAYRMLKLRTYRKEIIDLETNELDVELLSSEEIENMYKEDTTNANSI